MRTEAIDSKKEKKKENVARGEGVKRQPKDSDRKRNQRSYKQKKASKKHKQSMQKMSRKVI